MIIVDDKGNLFDDRRREDRRKKDIPVEEERRKMQRRTNIDNQRHEVTNDQIENMKNPNEMDSLVEDNNSDKSKNN